MPVFLKLYFLSLPVFLVLDMLWIRILAADFYQQQIGFLLREDVNIIAAIGFYLLYMSGLVFFAILPAVKSSSPKMLGALGRGSFFGLITYATYDLTNLATTKDWPLTVTIVDMAWGTFICGVVAVVVAAINDRTR